MAETTMTTISSPNTGDKYTHIHQDRKSVV